MAKPNSMRRALRRLTRGRNSAPRTVLAVLGFFMILLAAILFLLERETSVVTEQSIPTPGTSAASSATVKLPTFASPPPLVISKITTTRTPASDALFLGLLGLGAFLLFFADFYNRIGEVTGPGGWGFKLTKEAANAVARRTRHKVMRIITVPGPADRPPSRFAGLEFLGDMAMKPEGARQEQVEVAIEHSASQIAEATALATQYAQTLLEAAESSPDVLRTLAEEWEIPRTEWVRILATREISKDVWDRLADRALEASPSADSNTGGT